MGKKKTMKITVYASIEGEKTEMALYDLLNQMYCDHSIVHISLNPKPGGSPDKLIERAIDNKCRSRSFAWIDEDRPISSDTRARLAEAWMVQKEDLAAFNVCDLKDLQGRYNLTHRNPVLIVSTPVCADGLIIRLLGLRPLHQIFDPTNRDAQIKDLKNSLKGIHGKQPLGEYLKTKLTTADIEVKMVDISEIGLLVKMIKK